MSQKSEVKVGDLVSNWDLGLPKYDGCEFRSITWTSKVEITKVPEREPEVPDEPKALGAVAMIEGDDEFIAVRFTGADDMPYPFVGAFSYTGDADVCSWGEIVTRAAGRKIIVHKTADPTKVPLAVETYGEWLEIPEDDRKKYKWRDMEDDIWLYDSESGDFIPEDDVYDMDFNIEDFFPLFRCESIGE